jgi:hypothetical protein
MIKVAISGCQVDAEIDGTIQEIAQELPMLMVAMTQRVAAVVNAKPNELLDAAVYVAQRNINCKCTGIVIETKHQASDGEGEHL